MAQKWNGNDSTYSHIFTRKVSRKDIIITYCAICSQLFPPPPFFFKENGSTKSKYVRTIRTFLFVHWYHVPSIAHNKKEERRVGPLISVAASQRSTWKNKVSSSLFPWLRHDRRLYKIWWWRRDRAEHTRTSCYLPPPSITDRTVERPFHSPCLFSSTFALCSFIFFPFFYCSDGLSIEARSLFTYCAGLYWKELWGNGKERREQKGAEERTRGHERKLHLINERRGVNFSIVLLCFIFLPVLVRQEV